MHKLMLGSNVLLLIFLSIGCNNWWNEKEPRMAILEFDRSRKSMSCLVKVGDGVNRLLVKVCERKSKVTIIHIPNLWLDVH